MITIIIKLITYKREFSSRLPHAYCVQHFMLAPVIIVVTTINLVNND